MLPSYPGFRGLGPQKAGQKAVLPGLLGGLGLGLTVWRLRVVGTSSWALPLAPEVEHGKPLGGRGEGGSSTSGSISSNRKS